MTTLLLRPSIPRTLARRHWDGRLFVSDSLWRDPHYALGQTSAGWREVIGDASDLRALFGTLPRYPGEYVIRPADSDLWERVR